MNKENFLKRKTKRNNADKREENPIQKSNMDKVSQIEILYRKAKIIYEDKVFIFNKFSLQNSIWTKLTKLKTKILSGPLKL
jgi:hypothetical protein